MSLYQDMIEAFTIFARYTDKIPEDECYGEWLGTGYYEIFAGPNPEYVSQEDIDRLEELGWHDDRNGRGGFYKFR